MKKSKKENEKSKIQENTSFNLYYMNLNKVYEISMMINNIILSSYEKETADINVKKKYKKASLEGKIDSEYLSSIKSVLETGSSKERTLSSKMIEKLDVKTTKSILLKQIKGKCKPVQELKNCNEGELILLENVKLSILDKKNLRQMLLLKRDALKGIQIDGVEINNIISSMIKDYSYILSGTMQLNNSEKFVIKIPFELDNEFENNYNIDDIVLGNVSIIGIYKNKNNISDIANNTLNYFSNGQDLLKQTTGKFMKSQNENDHGTQENLDFLGEVHYIDIIGIIQEIKFYAPINNKVTLWDKFFEFIGVNKYEK